MDMSNLPHEEQPVDYARRYSDCFMIIQKTVNRATRVVTEHPSVIQAMEALCERYSRDNPPPRGIYATTLSAFQVFNYIEGLFEIKILKYRPETDLYTVHGKEYVKEQVCLYMTGLSCPPVGEDATLGLEEDKTTTTPGSSSSMKED